MICNANRYGRCHDQREERERESDLFSLVLSAIIRVLLSDHSTLTAAAAATNANSIANVHCLR